MGFELTINGKKSTQNDLEKMNQQPIEDAEDMEDMAMGLASLKRVKEAKGEKLPDALEMQLKSVQNKLGEEGMRKIEQSEDARDLNKGLDGLEEIKAGKREKSETLSKDVDNEKTKVCEKCGKTSTVEANFCVSCGTKFEKKPAEKEKISCGKCGGKIDADSNFCGFCGEKVVKEMPKKTESSAITWNEYKDRKAKLQNMEKIQSIIFRDDIDFSDPEAVKKAMKEEGLELDENGVAKL
jgi:hypothetical protein